MIEKKRFKNLRTFISDGILGRKRNLSPEVVEEISVYLLVRLLLD